MSYIIIIIFKKLKGVIMQDNINCSLTLQNKSFLHITGVQGVINLTENEACVLVCEETLEIKGENLKAEKLSVESGELILKGNIISLKFEEKREKKGLLKRIFK